MSERVIPEEWLPEDAEVSRVILHWTAGTYNVNDHEREAYHVIIDKDGKAHRGVRIGRTAAHVRGLNSGSVGISMAGMAGAVDPGPSGQYPITQKQWDAACQAAGEVLAAYDLPVTERTCLTHSEVTTVYNIRQRWRWDVDRLPFAPAMKRDAIREELRRKAKTVVAGADVARCSILANGKSLEGYIEAGSSYGPLRAVCDALGLRIIPQMHAPPVPDVDASQWPRALVDDADDDEPGATIPMRISADGVGFGKMALLQGVGGTVVEWEAETRTVRLTRKH